MEAFKVSNLTFCYPEAEENVLKNISFSVNSGEFITLCGPSGCGKSTLLRHLKPVLAPYGVKSGEILFENQNISALSQYDMSQKIGFVMQSAENQLVTDKVWHELAFGLESLGYDNSVIRRRVAETAGFFGIEDIIDRSVAQLSGGQKQIINLASIMAMQPSVLILDEPTSQLDPIAASEFLACVSKINRELGTTVIITEHRLDEILSLSDRVLVLENGEVVSFDTPVNTGRNLKEINSASFLSLPAPMRIWDKADGNAPCPVTVAQGRLWLEKFADAHKLHPLYEEKIPAHSDKTAVELDEIWFRYEKDSPDVLKGLSLKVYGGEFVAILGGNGAGKSTMLSTICGVNSPYRGEVRLFGQSTAKTPCSKLPRVALLVQNPQTLFVKKTVAEDLEEVFSGAKITAQEKEKLIGSAVSLCRLENLLQRHPYDLSGGEQQRAALAKVLLTKPQILLLDEPTKGLDAEFKIEFAEIISTLTASGVTVIMVSHDVEFCAKYPHRCVMLFNGEVVSQTSPREFFSSNSFYSTSSNRLSKGIIKNAVTAEDVIYCCTGRKEQRPAKMRTDMFEYNSEDFIKTGKKELKRLPMWKKLLGAFSAVLLIFAIAVNLDYISFLKSDSLPQWADYLIVAVPVVLLMLSFGSKSKRELSELRTDGRKRKIPKRTLVSAVMILLAVPLTIFIGVTYLEGKKYLFISLLVMLECMLPFFLIFEGRKPQARELVIIAVLCAIAVVGRMAFYFLPQFKPVIALVIISGVAFGGESGFLVGSMTMLLSNMMFQQGPWTPWQMFATGIIGFLAGVLFRKGLLCRSRISLCIFGFVTTVALYGVIMNISTAVTYHAVLNLETITAYLALGFPFDIVHGLSTVVFLYFGAEPMLEKLDRIKTKYGLLS